MEPVGYSTPYQSYPKFQEVTGLWDIVSAPFALLSSAFSYFAASVPTKKVPVGAPGHFLLGSFPEINNMPERDVIRLLVSYNKTYGKEDGICKIAIVGKTLYIVTNQELARKILKDNESFKRGESLRVWREFSPGGLSEGEKTQEYRTQAIHFIGAKNLPNYFHGMSDIAKQWIERLVSKGTFELFHEGERVALAAMGETFFLEACGENPFGLTSKDDERSDRFLKTFKEMFATLTSRFTSGLSSVQYIGDFLYRKIYPGDYQKIQECKNGLKDILAPIFIQTFNNPDEATPQAKKIFSDFSIDPKNYDINDIVEKSLGFLHGSFGTSSKAIAWILYLLGKGPQIQERLTNELRANFGDKPATTLEDLRKVPLLFQIIEEALRMYSPFPFLARDIEDPSKFDDFEVVKGGTFILSPFLMGHDERKWERPEEFNPDRFTSEKLKEDNFAFLDGIHRCPGRFFVKQEIAIVLASLFLNHRIVLEKPDVVPELLFNITLHSKHPVNARLEKI